MYSLAVIGAGQLGSRHLQALCALPMHCRIYVIDPSPSALKESRSRLTQLGQDHDSKDVSFHTEFQSLPEHLDYAVVATTSHARLTAMNSLLERSKVDALVLEKVLFSKVSSYADASALLQKHAAPTWINCTRREYLPYQALKQRLAGQAVLDFSVTGGQWGLGCNGIHFIDLLAFLSGTSDIKHLSTEGLDDGYIPSKRPGYIEFTGTLRGILEQDENFSLTSRPSAIRHLIQIRAERTSVLIDEVGRTMHFLDENDPSSFTSEPMAIPHISEIMTDVVQRILFTKQCNLPTFEESSHLHLPFITALAGHIGQSSDGNATCMIT